MTYKTEKQMYTSLCDFVGYRINRPTFLMYFVSLQDIIICKTNMNIELRACKNAN